MEYIVHRGYRPLRENSEIAIRSVMTRRMRDAPRPWVHIDVLYVGSGWVVCHDFDRVDSLSVNLKKMWPVCCPKGNERILINVIWDTHWNQLDNRRNALEAFANDIIRCGEDHDNIWLLFSDIRLFMEGRHAMPEKRIGFLLENPIDSFFFLKRDIDNIHNPDFVTINLRSFEEDDIHQLKSDHPTVFIIGNKCPNTRFLRSICNEKKKLLDAILCSVHIYH